jgi:hypothetical protein
MVRWALPQHSLQDIFLELVSSSIIFTVLIPCIYRS